MRNNSANSYKRMHKARNISLRQSGCRSSTTYFEDSVYKDERQREKRRRRRMMIIIIIIKGKSTRERETDRKSKSFCGFYQNLSQLKLYGTDVDAPMERITRNIRSISVVLPTRMKSKENTQQINRPQSN